MKNFLITATLLLALGQPCLATPDDPILKGMIDEAHRTKSELRQGDSGPPFYVGYRVDDVQQYDVSATCGALTGSTRTHVRKGYVDLHVGSYELDNAGFFSMDAGMGGLMGATVALDDDYLEVRRDFWQLTDAAYKQALLVLGQKKAALQARPEGAREADFSASPASVAISPRATLNVDTAGLEALCRRTSALFLKYPHIESSSVSATALLLERYQVNSDGSQGREPRPRAELTIEAATASADGQHQSERISFSARTVSGLPDEARIAAAVDRFARELTAQAAAPRVENYSGPVLFGPEAAAGLVSQLFAPQLSGERPPVFPNEEIASMLPSSMVASSKLAERLGRLVLPAFLSVKDEPRLETFGSLPLLGGYQLDIQGVPPTPLTLIDHGVLKTLLMTRRPRAGLLHSNGHAATGMWGDASAVPSNLIVSTQSALASADLKRALMEHCRMEHLPYGIYVRTMHHLTSGDALSTAAMMNRVRGGDDSIQPGFIYRVDARTGREEPLRGATVEGLNLLAMKRILAAGSEYGVYHGTTGGFLGMVSGKESSVVAPGLLFDELDVKPDKATAQKPRALSNPNTH